MSRAKRLAAAAWMALVAHPATGADLHVTRSGDDANDGLTWASAMASPRAALAFAESSPEADTIHVEEGSYDATGTLVVRAGIALLGGYPPGGGTRDPWAHPTILDAHGPDCPDFPVVYFLPGSDDTVLDGFILRHGCGGIRIADAAPVIRNCIIEQNAHGTRGPSGGVGVWARPGARAAELRIEDCWIRNNTRPTNGFFEQPAAAIEIFTALDLGLVLSRVLVEGNVGQGQAGCECAVEIQAASALLQDVVVRDNQTRVGVKLRGAIDVANVDVSGHESVGLWANCAPATLRNVTIAGSPASIVLTCGPPTLPVTVEDSILWDGVPLGDEPGVYELVVSNSIVQGGWSRGTGVLDVDPLFVSGARGDHYLADIGAGQPATSPAVDAGSRTAAAAGLDALTTRTDGVPDSGQVDLGYHADPVGQRRPFTIRRGTRPQALTPIASVASLPFSDAPGTLVDPSMPLLFYDVPETTTLIAVSADRGILAPRFDWR